MKIKSQGKVALSDMKYYTLDNTITILIDLKAKRAEILGVGTHHENGESTPLISLSYSNETIYLDDSYNDNITEISFPEYNGYDILWANISKYTLTITFGRLYVKSNSK